MFGRGKSVPVTPVATPRSKCDHSAYSGSRDGNTLACRCSNPACGHTWTESLTPAELGQVKEWTAG
ncbi:hypothetical protein ACIRG5_42425 [Lentzea sp. NPDC102401]|uniref:hypothetical protein n=1 Tax=Lentzea sp. NPDC102401 TaxID=3364128 RepID=UPI0037FD7B81